MGLKLADVQCLSKLKFVLSQVCRVLANMTPTRVKRGWVKIPACILARQPWPFGPQCLSSSKETQWVSGQRDTRFINLQQREGGGGKKFIFTETKGHLTFAFFITTHRSSSSLNFLRCQIEIWEHVVFLDSTSIIKIAIACFEYFMI